MELLLAIIVFGLLLVVTIYGYRHSEATGRALRRDQPQRDATPSGAASRD